MLEGFVLKIVAAAVLLVVVFGLLPFAGFAQTGANSDDHPLLTAKQKYLQAKTNYLQAKNAYGNAKAAFVTAKQAYQAHKNETQLRPVVKAYLGKTIDAAIKNLEKLENNVNESNAATIDNWISWLEGKKLELENATTKEQLISIAKDVHTAWVSHKRDVKRMLGQAAAIKINGVIQNANGLATKVSNGIQKLKEKGVDTTQLEALLADFQAKIALAQQKYGEAKQKYREADTAAEVTQLLQDANQFLKDAHAYLKQAHEKLREAISALKQKAGEPDIPAETPADDSNASENGTENNSTA